MKAAQACKQHGRMSLEYITIHNCLPGAAGLQVAQLQWTTFNLHLHQHKHPAFSDHLNTLQVEMIIAEMTKQVTTKLFVPDALGFVK